MDKLLKGIGAVVIVLFFLVLGGLITGYPVKWLMNWLLAPSFLLWVFGVSKLSFWKAYGLALLCGLLFKSTTSGSK